MPGPVRGPHERRRWRSIIFRRASQHPSEPYLGSPIFSTNYEQINAYPNRPSFFTTSTPEPPGPHFSPPSVQKSPDWESFLGAELIPPSASKLDSIEPTIEGFKKSSTGEETLPSLMQTIPLVLLRVLCIKGWWKGSVHYHHVFRPPHTIGGWFDNSLLPKEKKARVKVSETPLFGYEKRFLDKGVIGLLEKGGCVLRGIYEDQDVGMRKWKGVYRMFDMKMVDRNLTMRQLITDFLNTNPAPGAPLILVPYKLKDRK